MSKKSTLCESTFGTLFSPTTDGTAIFRSHQVHAKVEYWSGPRNRTPDPHSAVTTNQNAGFVVEYEHKGFVISDKL